MDKYVLWGYVSRDTSPIIEQWMGIVNDYVKQIDSVIHMRT